MRWVLAMLVLCGCRQLFGFEEPIPTGVDAPGGPAFAQEAYLKCSNADANDAIARSVAISDLGTILVVSSQNEASSANGVDGDQNLNDAPGAGAVYVFERSGTTWTQRAYLKASNSETNDNFGSSVSISGDGRTIAVGANLEDGSGRPNSGAVYIFELEDMGWKETTYLKASIPEVDDNFGFAVRLSRDGKTLAVSAPGEDSANRGDETDNTMPDAGAVYVFRRTIAWSQEAYVKAVNPRPQHGFGLSLALDTAGTTLAVGATGDASGDPNDPLDGSKPGSGAVFVFDRGNGTWPQAAYLKASNADESDLFGLPVAISGDGLTLAVNAVNEAGDGTDPLTNTAPSSGAVYVFVRAVDGWRQDAYLKMPDAVAEDRTHWLDIDTKGSRLAIGTLFQDSGATDSGAVYVFDRSGAWAPTAFLKASNPGVRDGFGVALALSGSGSTIGVSAFGEDSGARGVNADQTSDDGPDSGAVYVFRAVVP